MLYSLPVPWCQLKGISLGWRVHEEQYPTLLKQEHWKLDRGLCKWNMTCAFENGNEPAYRKSREHADPISPLKSMEYKYSNLSLLDGAKAWLVMTYNDSVRQDRVFSIQIMITTRWRSLLSGLYIVIFDDMSWHNYHDVANMIQRGRYLKVPWSTWCMLWWSKLANNAK